MQLKGIVYNQICSLEIDQAASTIIGGDHLPIFDENELIPYFYIGIPEKMLNINLRNIFYKMILNHMLLWIILLYTPLYHYHPN
jgi:hypothetical protein